MDALDRCSAGAGHGGVIHTFGAQGFGDLACLARCHCWLVYRTLSEQFQAAIERLRRDLDVFLGMHGRNDAAGPGEDVGAAED
jgi:hypothetical protein